MTFWLNFLATLAFNLGFSVDMKVVAITLVAGVFLFLGNYMPKSSAMPKRTVTNLNIRLMGKTFVISGFLLLISLLLPNYVTTAILLGFILVVFYLVFVDARR